MSSFQLASVVTAHAWSPDYSRIAVCENEPDVIIYSNAQSGDVKQWKKEHVLQNHTMVVVGIDWSKKTNQIVTCSHDVNAFVWTYDQRRNVWEPKLSILRINRAALSVRWSPDGSKFAVASASKVVPVCYYTEGQKWWVSKMIKKHKSTVIDVAWHPSSLVVATASSDFRCRVFSAFIAQNDRSGSGTVFGDLTNMEFGTLLTEFEAGGGWVEAVCWSPNGTGLCFAGHDSTISFVTFGGGNPVCRTVKSSSLPYTCLTYLNDNVVVAAGHSFQPEVYQNQSGSWDFLGSADASESEDSSTADKSGGARKMLGAFVSSKKMWEKKVKQGRTEGTGSDDLKTLHHNTVTGICNTPTGFSTSANDGRIVVWPTSYVKKNVSGIAI